MTEKITGRILSEAKAKADAIEAEAQQAYESVIAQAKEKAERITQGAEESAKAALSDAERRHVAVAELDAKKFRLSEKIRVLDEAFLKAKEAFLALDEANYRKAYMGILLPAIATGSEGIAPAKDEERLGEGFVAQLNDALKADGKVGELTLLPKREDISGGVVLCQGSMEVNFSTAAVMRQVREEIEGKTAKLPFSEEA